MHLHLLLLYKEDKAKHKCELLAKDSFKLENKAMVGLNGLSSLALDLLSISVDLSLLNNSSNCESLIVG
jgi:hypothetical protein